MKCKICETRKPRRYCPGVHGDICSICCGNEREVTVDCPLDCPYLAEARAHEKPVDLSHVENPNADIEVSQGFLRQFQELLLYCGICLSQASAQTPEAVDNDVRETLDALTRTYRTLASGLYYDTQPVNPFAKSMCAYIRESLTSYQDEARKQGIAIRDADILRCLVTYQRMELSHNNGRRKGRAFIGFLRREFTPQPVEKEPSSPLIEI